MCLFDFYGVTVRVSSNWPELVDLVAKDFSYFKVDMDAILPKVAINIECLQEKYQFNADLLNLKKIYTSKNSITYECKKIRYNDYYGDVLTIINYENENCELRSVDINRAHEVLYLLILSRVGKKLDLLKIHKLHAFAISYRDKVFVCMMPSKGGKSTLLSHLLCYEGVKMISDDIPLFGSDGIILPFPIKIGLVEDASVPFNIENMNSNLYFMDRKFYGRKKLICVEGIRSRVETRPFNFDKVIVSYGVRDSGNKIELQKIGAHHIFSQFFYHGIIGVGLPMILEYFWETGPRDFLVKAKIFLNRVMVFASLSVKAKKYRLSMSNETKKTASYIINFLDHV